MIEIASPLSGWVTPLDQVPDPVFADQMLGDGLAIDPSEGAVRAPGDGRVISVHPARHAVTVALDLGPVVLIHVGLDTVALGGEGFIAYCANGDSVRAGDLLLSFDMALLARRARSLATPVIVTNGDRFRVTKTAPEGVTAPGKWLLMIEETSPLLPDAIRDCDGAAFSREVVLPLAHGLHARPAARLAALCGDFDAKVELLTPDGRRASGRSAVAMLALSLRHGCEVTVSATGQDAGKAVTALVELIESGMGEYLAVAIASADVEAAGLANKELPGTISGIVAVAGTAFGPAHILGTARPLPPRDANDPQSERKALGDAISLVGEFLASARVGDGPQATIAEAHLALLGDPELAALADQQITAGRSAGHAWNAAVEHFAKPLRSSGDKRFAERVADLEDIAQTVQAALAGESLTPELPPHGAIVVGPDILPSQLMHIAAANPAGIALGGGGASSHVAIIAAGLGLPMVCGLGGAIAGITTGTELALHDGVLTIAPSNAERAAAEASAERETAVRVAAQARAHDTAITRDGARIEVFANLGSADDARIAAIEGAEGCGLLRTEFLFLDRPTPPSREEQREAYQAVADALGARPLIVRTLDIGADKPVPWLAQSPEENPALGCRGIRLQLARKDLLEDQFAALIATEAPGGMRIMLPMVSERAEICAAREVLTRVAIEAGRNVPELGIMVETPAAALLASTLATEADFFSIGSNDLSQYALARDRTAASVAAGLDGLHPAVLRLIAMTVDGANRHGRWVGLCGGLAADRIAVPILVGLGVTELSAPPKAVPLTKHVIRGLVLAECEELARQALAAPDAATVRAMSATMLEQAQ